MSKKKTSEAYQKTFAFRFFRWIRGEKDPYLGEVEMQPQEEYHVDEAAIRLFHSLYEITSVLFCLFLIALLLVTVSYLPATGVATKPVNNEVAKRYIENGLEETGAINIVAGMILDYKEDKNDRMFEPKNDAILQLVASFLVPIIMIFGIYIILNGHLGPGGGFSGGAVIGAGLVLYLNAFGFAKTERFFTEKTYKWVCFFSLSFYCLAKSYSFYTGANQLHSIIPKGTPGAILSSGLILPLNIAVGLVVACTIYAFYAMFRKGGF